MASMRKKVFLKIHSLIIEVTGAILGAI